MAAATPASPASSSPSSSGPLLDPKWISDSSKAILSTDCRTGKLASKPELTDLVIYHGDCPDGFAAAFGAWKLLGNRAQYFGAAHGPDAPKPNVKGKRVVMVDFCYNAATIQEMIGQAESLLVLDHHASAEIELAGVGPEYKVFEMGQSGATLSWNYFHGHDAPVPPLLRYVEDKDIWRWALKDSAEFTAGFDVPRDDFAEWDRLLAAGDEAMAAIVTKGRVILEYRNSVRDRHVRSARPCRLKVAPHFQGMIVNASVMASEIGNAICTSSHWGNGVSAGGSSSSGSSASGAAGSSSGVSSAFRTDYAIIWNFDHEDACFRVSLRSARDDVDVSAIAKALGGGGHKRASGFSHKGASILDLLL